MNEPTPQPPATPAIPPGRPPESAFVVLKGTITEREVKLARTVKKLAGDRRQLQGKVKALEGDKRNVEVKNAELEDENHRLRQTRQPVVPPANQPKSSWGFYNR